MVGGATTTMMPAGLAAEPTTATFGNILVICIAALQNCDYHLIRNRKNFPKRFSLVVGFDIV
jgi:hypothetical protein